MITEDLNWLRGKFTPQERTDFVKLVPEICEDGKEVWLHRSAAEALSAMIVAAADEQIRLVVISGFRSFDRQCEIWNAKWKGETTVQGRNLATELPQPEKRAAEILHYSAMPGTSRHHWGTDVDLNSVEPEYFENPEGRQVLNWLEHNAQRYGFARPYTAKGTERPNGYEQEPWHWSYLPLSAKLLEAYNTHIGYPDLKGFSGAETASTLKVIENYVNGIHLQS